jgi:putative hydrolase of the HAD superfamily
MIQAVLFDLYGTLVDIHTDEQKDELWQKLALFYSFEKALYSPQELKEAYSSLIAQMEEKLSKDNDEHESHPEIQIEEVFSALYTNKGIACSSEMARLTAKFFRVLSMDYIKLYPGVHELLDFLNEKGVPVYLLSNAQAIFTSSECESLDLPRHFTKMYYSSDYKTKKPAKEFYEIALRENQIDPKQAIMIGNDGSADIQGAKACGLHTFYIHSNISPDESNVQADYVLEEMDLFKVKDILAGLL